MTNEATPAPRAFTIIEPQMRIGGVVTENSDNRIGVCPIPRGALEYYLSIKTILMGMGFMLLPVGLQLNDWLHGLPLPGAHHLIPPFWGITLLVPGLLQFFAIRGYILPAYLAAFFCACAWLLILVTIAEAGLLLLIVPGLIATAGELYVSQMLKPAPSAR